MIMNVMASQITGVSIVQVQVNENIKARVTGPAQKPSLQVQWFQSFTNVLS